jgi:hypothetical protein
VLFTAQARWNDARDDTKVQAIDESWPSLWLTGATRRHEIEIWQTANGRK